MKRTLLIIFLLMFTASKAHALEWMTYRLTNDVLWDGLPSVSGNNIAWQHDDGNDTEVQKFDGNTIMTLTNNDVDDYNIDVGGNSTAWLEDGLKLYVNDGTSNTLLDDLGWIPTVSDDNVFWTKDFYKLFHYDGAVIKEPAVTPTTGPFILHADGGQAVWSGSDTEVRHYDGNTITNLSNDPVNHDRSPYKHKEKVVWHKNYISDGTDIFLFDLNTNSITNMTNDSTSFQFAPRLSDDALVWWESDGMHYLDLSTSIETVTNMLDSAGSVLMDGYLFGYNNSVLGGLWREDLLVFDGQNIHTLVDGSGVGAIQGFDAADGIVAWDYGEQYDAQRDIYYAKQVVPEPATSALLLFGFGGMLFRRRFK